MGIIQGLFQTPRRIDSTINQLYYNFAEFRSHISQIDCTTNKTAPLVHLTRFHCRMKLEFSSLNSLIYTIACIVRCPFMMWGFSILQICYNSSIAGFIRCFYDNRPYIRIRNGSTLTVHTNSQRMYTVPCQFMDRTRKVSFLNIIYLNYQISNLFSSKYQLILYYIGRGGGNCINFCPLQSESGKTRKRTKVDKGRHTWKEYRQNMGNLCEMICILYLILSHIDIISYQY